MADLLFEIGCEEMPARFRGPAMLRWKSWPPRSGFELSFEKAETTGTPRRLALWCGGLLDDMSSGQGGSGPGPAGQGRL
jgi:glycyl-tRNA synthetase beta chain